MFFSNICRVHRAVNKVAAFSLCLFSALSIPRFCILSRNFDLQLWLHEVLHAGAIHLTARDTPKIGSWFFSQHVFWTIFGPVRMYIIVVLPLSLMGFCWLLVHAAEVRSPYSLNKNGLHIFLFSFLPVAFFFWFVFPHWLGATSSRAPCPVFSVRHFSSGSLS